MTQYALFYLKVAEEEMTDHEKDEAIKSAQEKGFVIAHNHIMGKEKEANKD